MIAALTAGLTIPALLVAFSPDQTADFSKGLVGGLLAGAGFGYAQYCFLSERQRGTLDMLLHLPIEPRRLVLAKYASMYSMTLFTVNVPAVLVPNWMLIFVVNAAAVFLSTLFMSATVVSERPWAAQVPAWGLLVLVLPLHRLLEHRWPGGADTLHEVTDHPVLLAFLALVAVPFMVLVSTRLFLRAHRG